MINMNETIKNHRLVRHLYYRCRGIFNNKQLSSKARKIIQQFGLHFDNEDAIVKDMVNMYASHGFDFDEYLYFHFENRTMEERLTFVADWEHLGYTCTLNNKANAAIFDDKWLTYCHYKKYYKREVILCSKPEDFPSFHDFVTRHDDFIVKPYNASCGKGIEIYRKHMRLQDTESFFNELLSAHQGPIILEELITQTPEMARLHPTSVNTVRVTSIRLDDKVAIVHPFFRVGQGGMHVDNAGSGGIMGAVDVETGRIFATADEYCHTFTTHPDTGESIIGFEIPRWGEAKALVRELATVIPDNRYTGWDLALTDNGWILVEANRRGQFVGWQIPEQKGFRDEINNYLKRLNKKY